jgi:DNA-binding winged helix-turn-helix (wHTH) protein
LAREALESQIAVNTGQTSRTASFRFGDFTLCVETRRLTKAGCEIHLSPKTFELLKALVLNHPRALPKGELREILWPGIFVSNGNLALIVSELRDALGDDVHDPRYVRTLPAFGYACAADENAVTATRHDPFMDETSFWLMWQNRSFRLVEGANIIGRHPSVDVLLDLPGISRRHSMITIEHARAVLEDLGSKNGTFLDGTSVDGKVALSDRSRIGIGAVELTYRLVTATVATETLRIADRSTNTPRLV